MVVPLTPRPYTDKPNPSTKRPIPSTSFQSSNLDGSNGFENPIRSSCSKPSEPLGTARHNRFLCSTTLISTHSNIIMNKLYNSALAIVLLAGTASAQHNPYALAPGSLGLSKAYSGETQVSSPRPSPASIGARGTSFYSEDFSGGFPAGWTTVDDLTPIVDTPVLFEWANSAAAVTPAAANQPLILTFLAPGASDGFLWANSDRGLTSAPATEHLTRLTTTAIDCSGQPSVLFTMNSTIGVFDNNASEFVKVRVSTNGFDWTDFFPFPCLETGAIAPPCGRFSYNPQEVAVNITSVAANQPTVYLQFEWQGLWEYYWAIDDIALSPLPDNEIVLNYGYTSTTGLGEEYGRIPVSQLPSTMNVGGEVLNFGGADQTNVVVNLTVEGPGGPYNSSIDVGTITTQETAIADDNIDISSFGIGDYTATFSVTSDQIGLDGNTDDNSRIRTFEVTEFIYSLDNIGNHPAGLESVSQTGSGSFLDNSENVKLLNMYYINTPMTVTGLQIGIGAASDPGSSIVISILDTLDVLSTPSVVTNILAESDFYVLTAADIAAGVVNIPFPTPITLDVNAYYAVASCYADGTSDVFILDDNTVPQPALASALWIPFDPDNNQFFYGGNGTAWAIRLVTDPNISVQENEELMGITMYPNPTNGILRINSVKSEKYTVEVLNVLGAKVMTNVFTGNTVLDLAGFADGVYSVRVSNGTQSFVQRITLN